MMTLSADPAQVELLTHQLADALEQQAATSDILRVISGSPTNVQPVLDMIAESAARLCRGKLCFVFRFDGSLLHFMAHYGLTPEAIAVLRRAFPMAPGRSTASGRAVLSGAVQQIPDVFADADYSLELAEIVSSRCIVAVPMLRDEVPIGAIVLDRAEPGYFPERQIALLQTFADQAVIAIENVRLFEEVQTRTRELTRSLEDLRTAQDRLVQTEKLASLGQLTAGIAHEIKNPLNFINNFSALSGELIDELREALRSAPLGESLAKDIGDLTGVLRENLDKVVEHGKRADSIVKNMLLHSRAGSGEHRLSDINALVEESLNLAYHGARAEKQGFEITLEKDLDPEAGEVDVFPQEITRVLLNVISNGFYATTKRGLQGSVSYRPMLLATTRNRGESVEIRIRDNGVGISAEAREKVFNPFFTTKPAGEGTGLGLSISHDIVVKQHAGSIEVATALGEFTEFTIVLPRGGASLGEAKARL